MYMHVSIIKSDEYYEMGSKKRNSANFWDIFSWGIYGHMLVGGLEHGFYCSHHIGNLIIPTDFHIVQRGEITNQKLPSGNLT